ncbi:hypothetical protein AKJ09_09456 [Labilithrix luteola]|uniref:Uncharacterized protein n=1 Tax=Labilithrix luteola TaxID=1391654 RepID=A0A0K1QAN5_9BACT|nr:hypothetical protein AKJ09_09456 [Labilithrix luteola]
MHVVQWHDARDSPIRGAGLVERRLNASASQRSYKITLW